MKSLTRFLRVIHLELSNNRYITALERLYFPKFACVIYMLLITGCATMRESEMTRLIYPSQECVAIDQTYTQLSQLAVTNGNAKELLVSSSEFGRCTYFHERGEIGWRCGWPIKRRKASFHWWMQVAERFSRCLSGQWYQSVNLKTRQAYFKYGRISFSWELERRRISGAHLQSEYQVTGKLSKMVTVGKSFGVEPEG